MTWSIAFFVRISPKPAANITSTMAIPNKLLPFILYKKIAITADTISVFCAELHVTSQIIGIRAAKLANKLCNKAANM